MPEAAHSCPLYVNFASMHTVSLSSISCFSAILQTASQGHEQGAGKTRRLVVAVNDTEVCVQGSIGLQIG